MRGQVKFVRKEKVRRAVRFNDEFLVDLDLIADEICTRLKAKVFIENGISETQFEDLVRSPEKMDWEESGLVRNVERGLGRIEKVYTANMTSGATVETSDVGQMRQELRFESEGVEAFNLVVGQYGVGRLEVSLNSEYGRVQFSVDGARDFVNDLSARLRQLFVKYEPDDAIFRNRAILSVFGFLLGPILGVFTILKGAEVTSGWPLSFRVVAGMFAIVFITFTSWGASSAYSASFPLVEFEYGSQRRRHKARLRMAGWVISTIAVPVMLSFMKIG